MSEQMTLDFPPALAKRKYVVEVNEVGIFASGLGKEWWAENVLMRPIADRIHWVGLTPGGGVAQIPCADKEEAQFIRDHMIEHGISDKHVKVKLLRAAVAL